MLNLLHANDGPAALVAVGLAVVIVALLARPVPLHHGGFVGTDTSDDLLLALVLIGKKYYAAPTPTKTKLSLRQGASCIFMCWHALSRKSSGGVEQVMLGNRGLTSLLTAPYVKPSTVDLDMTSLTFSWLTTPTGDQSHGSPLNHVSVLFLQRLRAARAGGYLVLRCDNNVYVHV